MLVRLLLIIAIIVQSVAILFALRLVRTTKYNAIWILFIVGFLVLSLERFMQLIEINGGDVPMKIFYFTGLVASTGLSIGVMYAHKLFQHIDRLNHQRTLTSKRILSAVLHTEEKSRSRFSKDLHDGLGPLLSSAKMSLSALDRCATEQEREEVVANTKHTIDEAIRSLREISNNLSPQLLNDFGLARAIASFIKKSSMLHTTRIHLTTNLEQRRYSSDVEVVLYRVICELINNSLKHSKCGVIELSLNRTAAALELRYHDNGVGFNPDEVIDCGMGLSNISSRINSLNGEFEIASSPHNGMSATIVIGGIEEKNR